MTMWIIVALVTIFIVFVWSYPANYAPNWRDFLVAFATSLGLMIFFYSTFPKYSLGRIGLVILASITVSGFWATLLAMAWADKLSKVTKRKKNREKKPVDVYAIPDIARQDVWQRDKGKCVRCGSEDKIDFDYIVPVSKGGTHQPNNLQLLCRKCSQFKRVMDRIKPPAHSSTDTSPVSNN